MSLFVEHSIVPFLLVTVIFGGGVAFLAGRGLANRWRPYWQAVVYMMLLGLFIRFLHWGLFLDNWRHLKGDLLSLHYYITDTAVLILAASIGYRLERTRQMTRQYSWLYRQTSPFTWEKK